MRSCRASVFLGRSSVLAAVVAVLASGCTGGGGGGSGAQAATASGVAFKGPVADATVVVHELLPTGALGDVVGTGTSDSVGSFDVEVTSYQGWAVVRITGGTYVDEATGAPVTIQATTPLQGFVDVQPTATRYAITPYTTFAVALMQYFAHDPEATIEDNVENALVSTQNLFGLTNLDIDLPEPMNVGAVSPGPQADYGIAVAGLAQLAETTAVDPMELISALASDVEDGRLDGRRFGTDVPLGGGTLSATAGTTDLAAALVSFLASPQNLSGLTAADTTIDEYLAASDGVFDWPIQVRSLVNGYGDVNAIVEAVLEATSLPPNPQVLIEAQVLEITSQTATELGFEVPAGLALGEHDLVLRDQDTGLATRVRDAIEVGDPSAAPTVTGTSPPAGPTAGGTLLQIRGTNFGPDTEVEIGGVLAPRLNADFPRRIVVVTPPHAAGPVSVTVHNDSLSAPVPGTFEYRNGDVRTNASLPSATATIVFGGFRHYVDATNGFTAQALFGRSTFSSFDSGSFTLTDHTATDLAPAIATRQRSGTTFQSTESLGKAFLLFDPTNGLSDFVRGFTNEENGVSIGATAFGPAYFFPEPTNAQASDIAGKYWVSGYEVNVAQSDVRQKTGWLELDAALAGSASLLAHERDFDGVAFGLDAEKWSIDYTLAANGQFQGTRTTGASTETLQGHFNGGGDLGFLFMKGTDGTIGHYVLTPIAFGVGSPGWGGWVGGQLEQVVVEDGLGGVDNAFEFGSYRGLMADIPGGTSHLAFGHVTEITDDDPAGSFHEYVGARELDISPSGRIFDGVDLAGYVNTCDGILLPVGEFPNECLLVGGVDKPFVIGGAVFRESRKSFLTLKPIYTQVAIEAKLYEGASTNLQDVGTDFFDMSFDPIVAPTVYGVSIPLAGTIPELEAAAITGLHKSTVRDSTGAVTTERGSPPAWGVQVGYSFVDDYLDLYATAVTEPAGRFGDASMPRWLASGMLGSDGQIAALRGTDDVLGDTLMGLVANSGAPLVEPSYLVKAVGLAFETTAGAPTRVESTATDFVFAGNGNVAVTQLSRSMNDAGTFVSGSNAGAGVNTAPSGQKITVNIPTGGSDLVLQTVWTSSGDEFFGVDDTPGADRAELVIGIRPAVGGSFIDDDRTLIGLELNPQISRAGTVQLLLTPRYGSIMTGEILISRRNPMHAILPSQSLVSTAAANVASGKAKVPYINQIPVLEFLFNQRDEAAGQQDLTLSITPRIIHSLEH